MLMATVACNGWDAQIPATLTAPHTLLHSTKRHELYTNMYPLSILKSPR